MSEIPQQPTADELATWLNSNALIVEPEGAKLRIRYLDLNRTEGVTGRPNKPGRLIALGGARAAMGAADCPWPLAADMYGMDGQLIPPHATEVIESLVVYAVTWEEHAARREARQAARRARRTSDTEGDR